MPRRLRKLLGLSKVEDGHGYQAPKITPSVPSDAAAALSAGHGAVDGVQTNNTPTHAEDTDGAQDGTLLSGRDATLSQPMAMDNNTTGSLGQTFLYWERATQQLEEREPSVFAALQELRKESSCTSKDIPHEIIEIIEQHRNTMENKQWALPFKVRGREVKIRKQLDNVWKVLQIFNAVGNTLASVDPVHAGIPWAGVSFIVQGALMDSAQNVAAMEGLSRISLIVDRYLRMQTIYLGNQDRSRHEDFEQQLVDLYAAILKYQVAAACHCKRSTFSRFLRALPKVDDWAAMLQYIDEKDRACKDLASVFDSLNLRKHDERLEIIQSTIQSNEREVTRAANAQTLSWICDYIPGRDHQDVMVHKKMGTQYADSGQWLFDHNDYKEWRFQDNDELSTLWVCGAVGTGKTSLVSRVIEWHLQGFQLEPPEKYRPAGHEDRGDRRILQANHMNSSGVAYFYCVRQGQDQSGTDPAVILRSLVRQLASSSDGSSLLSPVRTIYNRLRYERPGSGCLSLGECSELLTELTSCYSNLTIIVDALDECEKPYELLRALKRVGDSSTSQTKLFVSSRLNVNVASIMIFHRKIDIQSQSASKDMEIFLHTEVKQRDRRLLKGRYPEHEDRLIKVLWDRAQGMFRWAELQLAIFLDENSPFRLAEDVISKLDRLKEEVGLPDLDLVYDEIYQKNTRVGTHDRENVMKTFKFLLYSFVDWNIHDLANAISLGLDGTLNFAINASYVLDICSNFIIVDHSEIVQFAHLSVSEYLRRGRSAIVFSDIDAHAQIAEVCLAYVMSPDAQRIVKEREDYFRGLREDSSPEERELGQADNMAITPDGDDVMYVREVSEIYSYSAKGPNPLGLDSYAFALCLDHCELASVAKSQEGALCDLFTTFMSVVELNAAFLSYLQVKPNAKTLSLICGIWTAQVYFDHYRIKKVHIEADRQDTFFAACAYGFTEILQELMSSFVNVDVNRRNKTGEPGIWVASRYGHFSVVELLLNEGAEVDIRDNHFGFTPLYEAGVGGHANIVALLLNHGADASARFNRYYCSRYLLYKEIDGADRVYDNVGKVNETLLHAIVRGRAKGAMLESELSSIVSLLLKHGASIEATNDWFETPLHIACKDIMTPGVHVLLHHGAFTGAQNLDGLTPLMFAAFGTWSKHVMVELLLKKSSIADIVLRDKDGRSVLSSSVPLLAREDGIEKDMTMLLLKNIDFQAARELDTPEGDEFVELADVLKKIGYNVLMREGWGLEEIAYSDLPQRPLINCFQAIAEKVDLGQLDWYDDDIADKIRKERVHCEADIFDTKSEEAEDDTDNDDTADDDHDTTDDGDADDEWDS